jgi:hypothetical protein
MQFTINLSDISTSFTWLHSAGSFVRSIFKTRPISITLNSTSGYTDTNSNSVTSTGVNIISIFINDIASYKDKN